MIRLCLLLMFLAAPAAAVQPDEILPNPLLESRAREISKGLRCLICRNENIDESNSNLARDLRLIVRERLTAGDSDAEVVDFIVDRYGEYALLEPDARGANLLLWIAGPATLAFSLLAAGFYIRTRRHTSDAAADLSPEDAARLAEILKE